MILAIRTDRPEADIGLWQDGQCRRGLCWPAGRKLSQELLPKIGQLIEAEKLDWLSLSGVVVYKGPGSFTGLRIGVTVANTIAYSLGCPVVGAGGDNWIEAGVARLQAAEPGQFILPDYGAEPNISHPRK